MAARGCEKPHGGELLTGASETLTASGRLSPGGYRLRYSCAADTRAALGVPAGNDTRCPCRAGWSGVGGRGIHDRAHARNPVGRKAAALRVLFDGLGRIGVIDAVHLVVDDVRMYPLDFFTQTFDDPVRFLCDGAQLV